MVKHLGFLYSSSVTHWNTMIPIDHALVHITPAMYLLYGMTYPKSVIFIEFLINVCIISYMITF